MAPTQGRHVLTLNAGSSSLKFGLFAADAAPAALATGLVERIGAEPRLKAARGDGTSLADAALPAAEAADHAGALRTVLDLLAGRFPQAGIAAVGHRVVHGGPAHAGPVAITPAILAELERLAPFAPLHQPHNLAGIRAALAAFPAAVQVAAFDTAFHRGHAFVHDTFALPREYYDRGVRRYGFHGLSYEYVAGELARIAPQLHAGRVVLAHLGNGASMCAMLGGRSIASTMGFSPLDGLPMGTRCGQLDPGVVLYLIEQEGMDAAAVSDLLYRRSGLLGLSGLSNDLRMLEAAGTPAARRSTTSRSTSAASSARSPRCSAASTPSSSAAASARTPAASAPASARGWPGSGSTSTPTAMPPLRPSSRPMAAGSGSW